MKKHYVLIHFWPTYIQVVLLTQILCFVFLCCWDIHLPKLERITSKCSLFVVRLQTVENTRNHTRSLQNEEDFISTFWYSCPPCGGQERLAYRPPTRLHLAIEN